MLECCTQVAEHVARAKTHTDNPSMIFCWRNFEHVMAQGRSSAELLQELLSRKVHKGACTEMYSDVQKCSDFAQEFRDVKLHLFPCPVERLCDCETLPGLAPRAARWRNAPRRHAVSCTSGKPVNGANAGVRNALMVQRVSSEQLAFTLQQAHQIGCGHSCLRERSSCGYFHRKVFTVDEDLHEQSGQQLASEFRLKLEAVLERNQTAGREACFRELQQRYAPVVARLKEESFDFKPQSPFVDDASKFVMRLCHAFVPLSWTCKKHTGVSQITGAHLCVPFIKQGIANLGVSDRLNKRTRLGAKQETK